MNTLHPRTRDLLRALTAAHAQDTQRSHRILKFFESGQALPSEPLTPEQNAVLRLVFVIVFFILPTQVDSPTGVRAFPTGETQRGENGTYFPGLQTQILPHTLKIYVHIFSELGNPDVGVLLALDVGG